MAFSSGPMVIDLTGDTDDENAMPKPIFPPVDRSPSVEIKKEAENDGSGDLPDSDTSEDQVDSQADYEDEVDQKSLSPTPVGTPEYDEDELFGREDDPATLDVVLENYQPPCVEDASEDDEVSHDMTLPSDAPMILISSETTASSDTSDDETSYEIPIPSDAPEAEAIDRIANSNDNVEPPVERSYEDNVGLQKTLFSNLKSKKAPKSTATSNGLHDLAIRAPKGSADPSATPSSAANPVPSSSSTSPQGKMTSIFTKPSSGPKKPNANASGPSEESTSKVSGPFEGSEGVDNLHGRKTGADSEVEQSESESSSSESESSDDDSEKTVKQLKRKYLRLCKLNLEREVGGSLKDRHVAAEMRAKELLRQKGAEEAEKTAAHLLGSGLFLPDDDDESDETETDGSGTESDDTYESGNDEQTINDDESGSSSASDQEMAEISADDAEDAEMQIDNESHHESMDLDHDQADENPQHNDSTPKGPKRARAGPSGSDESRPAKRQRKVTSGSEDEQEHTSEVGNGPDTRKNKGKGKQTRPRKPRRAVKKIGVRKRQSAKKSKKQREAAEMLRDLLADDAIADRAAHGDIGEAPVIREKKAKSRMFKEIIDKLPKKYRGQARKDKTTINEATKALCQTFGKGTVTAHEGEWKLQGLESTLYHHQIIAVEKMVKCESRSDGIVGGILADSMGLGKTVELLGLIATDELKDRKTIGKSRKKRKNDAETEIQRSELGTTLIVVPPSLLSQWESEIRVHMGAGADDLCQVYRGVRKKDRPKLSLLKGARIVLTTYPEVTNSLPPDSPNEDDASTTGKKKASKASKKKVTPTKNGFKDLIGPKMKGKTSYSRVLENIEANWKYVGDLHKMKFHRIILDEGHVIKGFKTKTSIACRKLNGTCKWIVTATPLHNGLIELFPYFNFLGASYAGDLQAFKDKFGNFTALDTPEKMLETLGDNMIRRTQKNWLLGRPIVDIPEAEELTINVTLSGPERSLYNILEKAFVQMINGYLAQGKGFKNRYATLMVMFLRLRQCICHPLLLKNVYSESLTLEHISELKAEFDLIATDDSMVHTIQGWTQQAATEITNQDEGDELNALRPPSPRLSSGQSQSTPFGQLLSSLDQNAMVDNTLCKYCKDLPSKPAVLNPCCHVFCLDCMKICMEADPRENNHDILVCPFCKKFLDIDDPYVTFTQDAESPEPDDDLELLEDEDDADLDNPNGRRKRKKAKPIEIPDNLPLSAKMVAIKKRVDHIMANDDTGKIVIFTQFRLATEILSKMYKNEGIEHVILTGEVEEEERHRRVKLFDTEPEYRIMIAGLKVGGVGLNLTIANHVISIDLWWNKAIERQSFGRIFRIGQTKKTTFFRVIANDTIDDRILALQKKKFKAIGQVMAEEEEEAQPLSVEDMLSLFGKCYLDDHGMKQLRGHRSHPESSKDKN